MNWLLVQRAAQIPVERILNALPEGILVALFVWALLRILGRQNSGTRFAVWFLTLLTVIALPVLGSFGGTRWLDASGISLSARQAAQASAHAWGNWWGAARPAITIPGRWAVFVFLAWAVGASVALVRLAGGLWRLRQLRRSCTAIVEADLDPVVRKTVEAISASRPVTSPSSRSIFSSIFSRSIRIASSDCVRVPAAIGFWRRTIVLPTWALRELSPEDLNVVLLHEFAHLRRWDEWTNLIQKIVRALFFFHPAVWWIEQRLSVEREMACDDAVLAETANPRGYATCLIALLEKSLAHRGWSMAQAAVHRAREASLRLAQILDKNRPAATRVWKPALGIAGVFSVICLAVLPHAPQFVGFDRGMPGNSGSAYSAAMRQSSSLVELQTAAVIPASFRTGGAALASPPKRSLSGAPSKVVHAPVVHAPVRTTDVAGREPDPVRLVAAGLNAAPARQLDGPAQAEPGQGALETQVAPQLQTLVFIEATQYVSRGNSVWSVQVWRVTLVSAARNRVVEVPVIKS
jgi:beta-lactamase regulating signal transducer with metallopeptidase domain